MIYLVPRVNCVCLNNNLKLFAGTKYLVEAENLPQIFVADNCLPIVLNFYEICKKFVNGSFVSNNCQPSSADRTKFSSKQKDKNACFYNGDYYIFLNFNKLCNSAFHIVKFKGKEIAISLGANLTISLGGEVVLETPNCNLTYSHFETVGDFCILYFIGERKFVAIIQNGKLFYANFYDQIEMAENEFYFLTRLNDSLNHGKVCFLDEKQSEIYLVYLDEYDLNLRPEFLPHVFLDCLLAGNFKYCNALLCETLCQPDARNIANFFCEFDYFYPLDNFTFATIKKDAIVGIYKFEIENDKIVNISEL